MTSASPLFRPRPHAADDRLPVAPAPSRDVGAAVRLRSAKSRSRPSGGAPTRRKPFRGGALCAPRAPEGPPPNPLLVSRSPTSAGTRRTKVRLGREISVRQSLGVRFRASPRIKTPKAHPSRGGAAKLPDLGTGGRAA